MKTEKTVSMNVKRATVCILAGFMLIQVNIKASDSTGVKANQTRAQSSYAYLNEEVFEAEYEIESWMTDVYSYIADVDKGEEEIEIEAWMVDTSNSFWTAITDTENHEIAIEPWMSNPQEWEIASNENLLCRN